MPLTKIQKDLVQLLAKNRTPESHLAGGAALHFNDDSFRFSNDLDYFHDSIEELEKSFGQDLSTLEHASFQVEKLLNLNGFIRCKVFKNNIATKIEWAHDSAWRFMPAIKNEKCGYQLHIIDIAINKLLALAGRDEARDYIDILYIDKNILSLGALIWAAVGKDPGFSPTSLFNLIQRRGKYQEEDLKHLIYKEELDIKKLKEEWLNALSKVNAFFQDRDPQNVGALYYSTSGDKLISPIVRDSDLHDDIIIHHGSNGGSIPFRKS